MISESHSEQRIQCLHFYPSPIVLFESYEFNIILKYNIFQIETKVY